VTVKDPAANLPKAWNDFCLMFHQDFFVQYSSLEEGIQDVISSLSPRGKKDLKHFIESTLSHNFTQGELKKMWTKGGAQVLIPQRGQSRSAMAFFQHILSHLDTETRC